MKRYTVIALDYSKHDLDPASIAFKHRRTLRAARRAAARLTAGPVVAHVRDNIGGASVA